MIPFLKNRSVFGNRDLEPLPRIALEPYKPAILASSLDTTLMPSVQKTIKLDLGDYRVRVLKARIDSAAIALQNAGAVTAMATLKPYVSLLNAVRTGAEDGDAVVALDVRFAPDADIYLELGELLAKLELLEPKLWLSSAPLIERLFYYAERLGAKPWRDFVSLPWAADIALAYETGGVDVRKAEIYLGWALR